MNGGIQGKALLDATAPPIFIKRTSNTSCRIRSFHLARRIATAKRSILGIAHQATSLIAGHVTGGITIVTRLIIHKADQTAYKGFFVMVFYRALAPASCQAALRDYTHQTTSMGAVQEQWHYTIYLYCYMSYTMRQLYLFGSCYQCPYRIGFILRDDLCLNPNLLDRDGGIYLAQHGTKEAFIDAFTDCQVLDRMPLAVKVSIKRTDFIFNIRHIRSIADWHPIRIKGRHRLRIGIDEVDVLHQPDCAALKTPHFRIVCSISHCQIVVGDVGHPSQATSSKYLVGLFVSDIVSATHCLTTIRRPVIAGFKLSGNRHCIFRHLKRVAAIGLSLHCDLILPDCHLGSSHLIVLRRFDSKSNSLAGCSG